MCLKNYVVEADDSDNCILFGGKYNETMQSNREDYYSVCDLTLDPTSVNSTIVSERKESKYVGMVNISVAGTYNIFIDKYTHVVRVEAAE